MTDRLQQIEHDFGLRGLVSQQWVYHIEEHLMRRLLEEFSISQVSEYFEKLPLRRCNPQGDYNFMENL